MVKALVICGDGLNCENETALAFKNAGADATYHPCKSTLRST